MQISSRARATRLYLREDVAMVRFLKMRPGKTGSRSHIYVGDLFLDSTLASLLEASPSYLHLYLYLHFVLLLIFILTFVLSVSTSYIGFCNLLTMLDSFVVVNTALRNTLLLLSVCTGALLR